LKTSTKILAELLSQNFAISVAILQNLTVFDTTKLIRANSEVSIACICNESGIWTMNTRNR